MFEKAFSTIRQERQGRGPNLEKFLSTSTDHTLHYVDGGAFECFGSMWTALLQLESYIFGSFS